MKDTDVKSMDYMSKVSGPNGLRRISHAFNDFMLADEFSTGLTGRLTDKQVREIDRQIQKRFRVMAAMHTEIVELRKKRQELLNQ